MRGLLFAEREIQRLEIPTSDPSLLVRRLSCVAYNESLVGREFADFIRGGRDAFSHYCKLEDEGLR